MDIDLLNESTLLTELSLKLIAAACQVQVHRDFKYHWPVGACNVRTPTKLTGTAWPVVFFDDSDQAGALAYHSETPEGLVYAKVFVKTILDYGGEVLSGPASVSGAASHEILEALGDAPCNEWAQRADNNLVARELCDPVESDAYSINVRGGEVAVSNFVLPAWFDPENNVGAWDFLGTTSGPFKLARGGYDIVLGASQPEWGEGYPDWRKPVKAHPASRTARRFDGVALR